MSKIKYFLLSLLFTLVASCNNSNDVEPAPKESPALTELIQQTLDIRSDIEREFALKRASDRDRETIVSLMYKIEIALVGLNVRTEKVDTFRNRILELADLLEQRDIPLRDKDRFDNYVQNLKNFVALDSNFNTLGKTSTIVNLNVGQMFSYDFSDGLPPFISAATTEDWSFGEPNSVRPFSTIRVKQGGRGQGNTAFLIAPLFDLTNVKKASLRVRHSVLLNANNRTLKFDRLEMMQMALQLRVSTDFHLKGSQVSEATWDYIDLELPLGEDFHTITTDGISLEKYEGKVVTIALVMDYDAQKFGDHYMSWTVEQFILLGAGSMPTPVQQSEPVTFYAEDFSGDIEDRFSFYSLIEGKFTWRVRERNGANYIEMSKRINDDPEIEKDNSIDAVAVSKEIKLPTNDKSYFLSFDYTIRWPDDTKYNVLDKLQLSISTNFKDGMTPDQATWEPIDFHEGPVKTNTWANFKSLKINLDKYKGQNIRLAYTLKANPNEDHLWQVKDLLIVEIEAK